MGLKGWVTIPALVKRYNREFPLSESYVRNLVEDGTIPDKLYFKRQSTGWVYFKDDDLSAVLSILRGYDDNR
jgi:hypothetical protein